MRKKMYYIMMCVIFGIFCSLSKAQEEFISNRYPELRIRLSEKLGNYLKTQISDPSNYIDPNKDMPDILIYPFGSFLIDGTTWVWQGSALYSYTNGKANFVKIIYLNPLHKAFNNKYRILGDLLKKNTHIDKKKLSKQLYDFFTDIENIITSSKL